LLVAHSSVRRRRRRAAAAAAAPARARGARALLLLISPTWKMGYPVEHRPRGAGRPTYTCFSRGYWSETDVHLQGRLGNLYLDAPRVHLAS
jgi:hypothetical protein